MITARQAAYETIYNVFYNGAYSNLEITSKNINPSDRALATRLCHGVIERKITLDYIIEKFCKKPKPRVLVILEIGVYQLYFMSNIPDHAAVDECVKLAYKNSLGAYTSFINAVLRKINLNRIDIIAVDDLSIKFSIPENLISMWIKAYSSETVLSFLPALITKAPIFVVPNLLKTTLINLQKEIQSEGIDSQIDGKLLILNTNGDITKLKAFKEGLFFVEDKSSFEAVLALNPNEGETLIDVCAAPGGKSFSAAILMNNRGEIHSFDKYESRCNLINTGAKRLGCSIKTSINDALTYSDDMPAADKIICDVPCSGFGVIRRKPEIKYKNLDDIKKLPEIQLNILSTSVRYLKPGGSVLYSTCTLNKKENEKVVDSFLRDHDDFLLVEEKTIFPNENGGDGFYYAILKNVLN